jgi:hypothetical protein
MGINAPCGVCWAWNGMEWHGMAWNGAWNGMEWHEMAWNGMAWNGAWNGPAAATIQALMRFEWVECIVRIAIAKYFETGTINDMSDSVQQRCEECILPNLEPAVRLRRNDFRRNRLYSEAVDDLLKRQHRMLRYIFDRYCALKRTSQELVMSMNEWIKFVQVVCMHLWSSCTADWKTE